MTKNIYVPDFRKHSSSMCSAPVTVNNCTGWWRHEGYHVDKRLEGCVDLNMILRLLKHSGFISSSLPSSFTDYVTTCSGLTFGSVSSRGDLQYVNLYVDTVLSVCIVSLLACVLNMFSSFIYNYLISVSYISLIADPSGRAVLRPLGCWGRGFESLSGHGCLSVVFICCVVLCR
jgi:hypothetical protein